MGRTNHSYPETLHDKNLSSAMVRLDGSWEDEERAHPRHRLVRDLKSLPTYLIQKGQKIIVVRMLQDKSVCIHRDVVGDDIFLDNGMGKS